MIVWLASFPRSGNTLLRQLVHDTLGLASYSDEKGERTLLQMSETMAQQTGMREFDGEWADFYREASASRELFLVKTHRAPPDDQPAIYVVRDGRRALISYERFHDRYTAGAKPGLLDLVLGLDYYGSWSAHYQHWLERPRKPLLLRYEDLVAPNAELLRQVAAFLDQHLVATEWHNPFASLQSNKPDFYRQGAVHWSGEEAWTPWIDALFMRLHGGLMEQLGYLQTGALPDVALPQEQTALLESFTNVLAERDALRKTCDDRLAVIEDLKATCDERLALIQRLSGNS